MISVHGTMKIRKSMVACVLRKFERFIWDEKYSDDEKLLLEIPIKSFIILTPIIYIIYKIKFIILTCI